jgi:hypothetical protein
MEPNRRRLRHWGMRAALVPGVQSVMRGRCRIVSSWRTKPFVGCRGAVRSTTSRKEGPNGLRENSTEPSSSGEKGKAARAAAAVGYGNSPRGNGARRATGGVLSLVGDIDGLGGYKSGVGSVTIGSCWKLLGSCVMPKSKRSCGPGGRRSEVKCAFES